MRRFHFVVGVTGVVVFLLTGQYMAHWLGHLDGMADLPRMLYRSGHIYLLFAALLNLVLGLYADDGGRGWRRSAAMVGSLLILAAPLLLLIGFAVEATRTDYVRPYARLGIVGSAAGVVLHAIARWAAAALPTR